MKKAGDAVVHAANFLPAEFPTGPALTFLAFRIAPNCKVSLNFTGQITQRGLDKIITIMETLKDSYPADSTDRAEHAPGSRIDEPDTETSTPPKGDSQCS